MEIINKLILIFSFIVFIGCSNQKFSLQKGDLLFQARPFSEQAQAINGAGYGYNGLEFTHVGIVDIKGKDTVVIEATKQGVRYVPIQIFFDESYMKENKPYVYVGRLLTKYKPLIETSIERANKEIGKSYDTVFLPNNNAFYCSELVYECFRDNKNNPIFESRPMSFKDKQTGDYYPIWIKFYSKIGIPIPQDTLGTNPNDMSNSKAIKIIYNYLEK